MFQRLQFRGDFVIISLTLKLLKCMLAIHIIILKYFKTDLLVSFKDNANKE